MALRDGQVNVSIVNDHRTDLSVDTGVPVDHEWAIYSFTFTATDELTSPPPTWYTYRLLGSAIRGRGAA